MKEHVEWCVSSRTLSERRDTSQCGVADVGQKLAGNYSWVTHKLKAAPHITSESRSEDNTVSLSTLHEKSACTCSLHTESPEVDLFLHTSHAARREKNPEIWISWNFP